MSRSFRHARARRSAAFTAAVALTSLGASLLVPTMLAPAGATIAGSGSPFASTSTIDFKKKCPAETATATLAIGVDREKASGGGSTPAVFANSATLTVTLTAPTGSYSVDRTVASIVLPSDWGTQNNARRTADFAFTWTAPATTPADQPLPFTVSGPATGGGTATLNGTVTLTGEVRTPSQCAVADSTPPVVTPTVTGTLGTNGWYTSDVGVSWTVSDAESAITSSTGCGASTRTTDTTGTTFTCSATSAGGTTTVPVTIKRDATAPTVNAATLQPGSDTPVGGVFNAPFSVAWSGSDATSGIASCDTRSYSGPDTSAGSLSGGCTDNAGNTAAGAAYTFGYDATGPVITPVLTRSGDPLSGPDSNGWFNAPFTLDWSADESGVSCPAATEIGGVADETAGETVTVTCTDAAGNTGDGTFTYKYDQTAPTVTVTPSSDANAAGWRNSAFTLTASGEDGLSGGVTCDDPISIGGAEDETAAGSESMSCTDAAGNTGTSSPFTYKYDETAPTASIALDRDPVDGWYNAEVTGTTTSVTPDGATETSAVTCSDPQTYSGPDAENASLTGTCTDEAGNTSAPASVVFNYDETAPAFVLTSRTAATGNDGTRDWNNTDVTVVWTCTDATSGFDRSTDPVTMTTTASDTVTAEGLGQSATASCTDVAGNTTSLSEGDINIDKTAPAVSLVGGPADGGVYYFGFVPAAPTCTASDEASGSGLAGPCSVSGYGAATGGHTVSAHATDNAGNSSAASASYTVNAWTLKGFYQPVDMSGTLNTVKGGSTVPLKFELFAGPTELTDVASIKTFTTAKIQCNGTAPLDEVEITSTGQTVLRYDATAGQFIQNWKTPTGAGTCYRATMTAQDGSTVSALFKLK